MNKFEKKERFEKNKLRQTVLIGYSGHSYVAADILIKNNYKLTSYCEVEQKNQNPFNLNYLGLESSFIISTKFLLKKDFFEFFISIGNNAIRELTFKNIHIATDHIINAIHPSSILADSTVLGAGILIAAGAVVNPFSKIGNGVICNTQSSIDHECIIEDFAHIGPGATLCGNVKIGERTFIGAGSVVKQGIIIGKDVIVGAGAVVVKDIESNRKVSGCPAKDMVVK